MTRRILPLLLLIGALTGLLGAQLASAAAPAGGRQTSAATMGPGCTMNMAAALKTKPDGKCHGLTLQCIAAMGCLIPLADLRSPADISRLAFLAPAPAEQAARVLVGLRLHPEPDPPSA